MVDKLLNGVVYAKFDEKIGPEALAWFPEVINSDIRNIVSLKTINIMAGEKGSMSESLAILPFPSFNLKGLVRSFQISDKNMRGGTIDASLTILFDEAMDLIYYKYLKHVEPIIHDSAKKIKSLEETDNGNIMLIGKEIKNLYKKFYNLLGELRDNEISSQEKDAFGHVRLGGIGHYLAKEIEKRMSVETRVTVLGHVQRGGSPTAHDRVLATRFGVAAVELIKDQNYGKMVALQGNKIVPVDLKDAVSKSKTVDMELYDIAKLFFG